MVILIIIIIKQHWSLIELIVFKYEYIYIYIYLFLTSRARLVYVFKNWKLLFKNFCRNTCRWKSVWKYVKYCLKIENCCLETLTKHPPNDSLTIGYQTVFITLSCSTMKLELTVQKTFFHERKTRLGHNRKLRTTTEFKTNSLLEKTFFPYQNI